MEKRIKNVKKTKHLTVQRTDDGCRLDVFLTRDADITSRSFAQNLISQGLVRVDERVVTKNHQIKEGEKIVIEIPPLRPLDILPEPIAINVLYEDNDLMVLSKPAGMVVHPAGGRVSGTLVNALLFHTRNLSGIGGVQRPGIVHRLDKNTSGLMLVAKNDCTHAALSGLLKERKIKRSYLALVNGVWKADSGTIDAPIGRGFKDSKKMVIAGKASRRAVTHFKVLERLRGCTLLEVQLDTGRTHQIRVHMAYAKHPVIGDPEYGFSEDAAGLRAKIDIKRQFLHAHRLGFVHPTSGKSMIFEDALPEELQKVLEACRSER